MLTAVMNCFHSTCIPLHSHSVSCIIPHDNPYPYLTTARPYCLRNGSLYYIIYLSSSLLEQYGCNFLFLEEHMPFSVFCYFLQYDTIHTFSSFVPLNEQLQRQIQHFKIDTLHTVRLHYTHSNVTHYNTVHMNR